MSHYLPLALFVVPLLSLARPLWRALGLGGTRINGWLGFSERWGTRWRGLFGVGYAIWLGATAGFTALPLLIALFALLGLGRWQRHRAELGCAELMWISGRTGIHEFYLASDQVYGPAGRPAGPLPESTRGLSYDYRGGASGKLRGAFLRVFFGSAFLTGMALRAGRKQGNEFLFREIDRGMRLWGLKVLESSRACLRTDGMEKLDGLPGKRLFLFTHVSQTDFAYGFPALDHFIGTEQEIRLRFIVAKDHFVDNPLIHSWSGIGRLIMAVGMVAVDRRRTKGAIGSMEAAATQVADRRIDLAIYPQGTRGRAQYDAAGKLIDVGYYSSGRRDRAADPLGHIKKGAAYLALDVAIALQARAEPLQLVIVGIEGAGRVLPKGSLALRAGVSLTYTISEVIRLEAEDVAGLEKRGPSGKLNEVVKQRATELTARIERALARACRIDERLAEIWQTMFARPMPDSAGLCRLFDHALTFSPARRRPLFDALERLPETVGEQDLAPLFERLEQL